MMPKILIVGSFNSDMFIKADHLPGPGETVIGGTFFMSFGGKGTNQAIAAARLGGNITFICKTGNDIFGRQAIEFFEREGIDTTYIVSDTTQPSGMAFITVDKKAENCVVVASGANASFNRYDLQKATGAIENSSIVLMQLETPIDIIDYVASIAFEKGIKVVLNPAPVCELTDELLSQISIITPNEMEAEMLTGVKVNNIESAKKAAQKIKGRGVESVIITLGNNGALVLDNKKFTHVPAFQVEAVDTTAAGDIFNGALVVALAQGKSLLEATVYGCKAAAISVTRLGAQSSAPYKTEVTV
jgi:ribokinase